MAVPLHDASADQHVVAPSNSPRMATTTLEREPRALASAIIGVACADDAMDSSDADDSDADDVDADSTDADDSQSDAGSQSSFGRLHRRCSLRQPSLDECPSFFAVDDDTPADDLLDFPGASNGDATIDGGAIVAVDATIDGHANAPNIEVPPVADAPSLPASRRPSIELMGEPPSALPPTPPGLDVRKSTTLNFPSASTACSLDCTLERAMPTTTIGATPSACTLPSSCTLPSQRQLISDEILTTEQSYVRTLRDIQRLFMTPLKSQPPILTKKQLADVFSNVEDLLKVNMELLAQLEQRMLDPREWEGRGQCLGDIFLYLAPFLKIYAVYVKNYQSAIRLVMELERKHQPFCAFLRETLRKPECKGLTFQAYILTPVQRIPRYKLLLSDLLKHTPVDHADHVCLTKALAIIESVASFVNERIREQETVVKMVELQKSISGLSEDLLIAGRRLLKRGPVLKVCRKSRKPRMLFLFSDMLLYAAFTRGKSSVSRALSGGDLLPSGNVFPPYGTSADDVDAATFQFRRKFDLEFVRVVDVEDGWLASTVVGSPSSVASRPPLLHCFQVQTVEKSFAVVCRNAKDKEAWMTAIDGAVRAFLRNRSTLKLEEDRESGGTRAAGMSVEHSDSGTGDVEATSGMASLQVAPVWVPDSAAASCMQCDAEFGMITRRHHCRACGRLVCGACSPHRARISTHTQRASQHRSSTFSLSGVAGGLVGETAPAVRVCVACHQNISGKLDIVLEDEATEELTADTKENSRSSACQGWTTRILRAVGVGSTPVDTSTQPDGKDGSDASSTKTSVSTIAANIMAASASNQINVPSRLRKDSLLVPTPFLASSMSSGSSYSVKAMAIAQRKVTADAGAVRNLARTGSIVVESPLSSSWSHDTGVTKRQMEQLQQLRRRGETCVAADTKKDSVDAVSRRAFQPLIAEAQRDALSKTMSAPPSSAPPPRPHRESFGRMLPITSRLESLENDKPHFPRKLSLAALREKVIKSGSGTDDHGHKIDEDDDDNYDPDDVVYTGFLIKRGNRFKSWKMRYLVLTRSELQWFKPDEYERQLSGERGKSANVSPHFLSSINLHDCVEVGYTVNGECILPQITTAMTSMLALGSNTASSRTSISVRDLLVMPDMRDLEKLESGAVSGPAFPFKLVSPSRTLYMVAFTAAEREEWVVKLTEAVRDAWHRHQLLDKENVSRSGSALSALVGGGPANLLTPL